MDKEIKQEFEGLARMVKNGFDGVDKRFEQIDERFEKVEGRMDRIDIKLEHIDARLSYIERDIEEIRRHFVYRDEFEDLMARVKYLEQKLDVVSGK